MSPASVNQRRPRDRVVIEPTGRPSWPIGCLSGVEKSSKTWKCAEASGSPLIGQTYWVAIGENLPHEYARVPGARFKIVPTDGTYRDILAALDWIAVQPRVNGLPNLEVIDSGSRFWDLLCDTEQIAANRQAAKKAARTGQPISPDDQQITMNLWNEAADRWAHFIDAARGNDGPVLITARLEHRTVVDDRGEPTKEKIWKVLGHKSLPYDADFIVQMRQPWSREGTGDAYLTGVRSVVRPLERAFEPLPEDFTIHALWTDLGLTAEGSQQIEHARINADPTGAGAEFRAQQDAADEEEAKRVAWEILNQIKVYGEKLPGGLPEIVQEWGRRYRGPDNKPEDIRYVRDTGRLRAYAQELAERLFEMDEEQSRSAQAAVAEADAEDAADQPQHPNAYPPGTGVPDDRSPDQRHRDLHDATRQAPPGIDPPPDEVERVRQQLEHVAAQAREGRPAAGPSGVAETQAQETAQDVDVQDPPSGFDEPAPTSEAEATAAVAAAQTRQPQGRRRQASSPDSQERQADRPGWATDDEALFGGG